LLQARTHQRRLTQITASQAEAEAVIAQSVENLYALGGVAPGASMRYEWFVPDTAGPGSRDGPVVVYAYVSGVDHIKHINAGARPAASVWTWLPCQVLVLEQNSLDGLDAFSARSWCSDQAATAGLVFEGTCLPCVLLVSALKHTVVSVLNRA
jgi:hypothetical protein